MAIEESLAQPIKYPGRVLTTEEVRVECQPPSEERIEAFTLALKEIEDAERQAWIDSRGVILSSLAIHS